MSAKLCIQLSSCAIGALVGALSTSSCSDDPTCGSESTAEIREGSFRVTSVESTEPVLNAALSDAAPAMISVRSEQVRIVYARDGAQMSAVYDVVYKHPETTLTEYRP
jgi:hypothetical protein